MRRCISLPHASSRPKRSQNIRLTLLANLGVSLVACSQPAATYTRLSYPDYTACYNDYRLIPGLERPCVQNGGAWYGPYSYGSSDVHYLGYSPTGALLTAGVIYNFQNHSRSTYQEPRTSPPVKTVVTSPKMVGASGGSPAARGPTADSTASSRVSRAGFGSSSRSSSGSFGG